MPYSPHLLTTCLHWRTRLEIARGDAAAGRMTAEQAVEFAADVIEGFRAEARDREEANVRDANYYREEARDAERRADDLETAAERRRDAVLEMVRAMEATGDELLSAGAGAGPLVKQIAGWAAAMRKAFGIIDRAALDKLRA